MTTICGFKPTNICKECKGKCCKELPGSWYPEDFSIKPNSPPDVVRARIISLLKDKQATIDWWENDYPDYFLRPPAVNDRSPIEGSWGGACIFLNEDGCTRPFKLRPTGCRMLQPLKDKCNAHGYTKRHSCDAWASYNDILKSIVRNWEY